MKKIIALILVLTACLTLFACKKPSGDDKDNNKGDGTPYTVISDKMIRYNCKDGNGYDKSVPESNSNWIARLNGIELGVLKLYGCEKTANGYKIVNDGAFGIKYKVTQNLGALVSENGTKNGAESIWVNSDSNAGVLDTDIRTAVGVGAYYIKVTYADGSEKSVSGTDFFRNAEKGSLIDMLKPTDTDSEKTVSTVAVTLVYETYAEGAGVLGVKWKEYANWRCEYTYNFKETNADNGVPYEIISSNMTASNSKDGSRYDTNVTEPNETWVNRVNGVKLGKLELHGCAEAETGFKEIVNKGAWGIKYKVTQNLGDLVSTNGTKNGAESMWVNADNDLGVSGTDINTSVGVGACFVRITYTDGSTRNLTKTDFFRNAQKGAELDIVKPSDLDTGKTLLGIEITLVYEIYAGAPGALGIWWHEYTNWRCEYAYKFVQN
jgi:hypothetical protein